MDGDTFIIYMVFVFSLVIGGSRGVEEQNAQNNSVCYTPNDLKGSRIDITRCTTLPLVNLLQNYSINSIDPRNSMRGNEDNSTNNIKVCCPLENEPTTHTETSQRTATPNNDSKVSEIYNIDLLLNLPSQKTCGLRYLTSNDINIVHGQFRKPAAALPWLAILGYITMPNLPYVYWNCGGSLISDRYVLTAARCILDFPINRTIVRLGDLELTSFISETIDVGIERISRHNQNNTQEITNDIALLKLIKSVVFNKSIQPICLPILSHHRTNTFVESDLFVTEWGYTWRAGPRYDFQMEIKLRVKDNSECKRAFAKKHFVINDRMLCAGSSTGEQEACQGDSGGPLMWKNGDQYYLVGIVSFRYTCDEKGYPGVYTRVTSFIEWILDNMN